MIKFKGGDLVERGVYWNFVDGCCVRVRNNGKKIQLVGNNNTIYYKIPFILMPLVSAFAGLALVLILPILGFIICGIAISKETSKFFYKDNKGNK